MIDGPLLLPFRLKKCIIHAPLQNLIIFEKKSPLRKIIPFRQNRSPLLNKSVNGGELSVVAAERPS